VKRMRRSGHQSHVWSSVSPRAARLESVRRVVDDGRVVVVRRPRGVHRELARVDEAVPGRGHAVPVEARGDVPVPDDQRRGAALLDRLLEEGRQAAGVVHVTVGIDGGVEGTTVHRAHGGEGLGPRGVIARVHEDEPRLGADGGDIGPGVEEDDTRRELLALVRGPPQVARRDLPLPEPLGQFEDVAHVRRTVAQGAAGGNRGRSHRGRSQARRSARGPY